MLSVLPEEPFRRIECLTCHTSEKFFGHASTINASFLDTKFVLESDLNGFLETCSKLIEVIESVLELMLAPHGSVMSSEFGVSVWVAEHDE